MEINELKEWERIFSDYLIEHTTQKDGSHDLGHFKRVWKTTVYINGQDQLGADLLVLLASAYFHDLVSLPKNHPDRSRSSFLSAEKTATLLTEYFSGFPQEKIDAVRHAIHAHSFSGKIKPHTPEAEILQDADRLEALGAIGLARVFYTAGQLNQQLFEAGDPLAEHRAPDDQLYALDHFKVKLLKLPGLMNTHTGRSLAEENAAFLTRFLRKINFETGGDYLSV
jgi:uncharacterized protein